MKPIPAQHAASSEASGEAMSPLPGPLTPGPGSFSASNRRANHTSVNRAYPWLLAASTLTAIFFCLMYVNKPLMDNTGKLNPPKPPVPATGSTPLTHNPIPEPPLLPGKIIPDASAQPKVLPKTKSTPSSAPMHSIYEETNLRMQHILTAEAPGGHVNRIDIEVPVLYQSRNLRWTAAEVAEARSLMLRLMNYQDKTRQLKTEGQDLLAAWSKLMGQSIPSAQLRADSPSLPVNQEEATKASNPAGANHTNAIQLNATE